MDIDPQTSEIRPVGIKDPRVGLKALESAFN
jgi:hypothetical protein